MVEMRITLDDKMRVGSVELYFNEETEKHFLIAFLSAEIEKGAFPLSESP
ncbi:hypothetical protein J2TS4_51750 [Paenibacillus sp. J2TS4]|nr:hypothetical protein J2TS4_51750 [Paenibacillus sp. J2TS4]